jgi:hypothetical protein
MESFHDGHDYDYDVDQCVQLQQQPGVPTGPEVPGQGDRGRRSRRAAGRAQDHHREDQAARSSILETISNSLVEIDYYSEGGKHREAHARLLFGSHEHPRYRTVLVKSTCREATGRSQTLRRWRGGG